MGVGAGFCVYDVVVKSSRSLSHLLISFLYVCVERLDVTATFEKLIQMIPSSC